MVGRPIVHGGESVWWLRRTIGGGLGLRDASRVVAIAQLISRGQRPIIAPERFTWQAVEIQRASATQRTDAFLSAEVMGDGGHGVATTPHSCRWIRNLLTLSRYLELGSGEEEVTRGGLSVCGRGCRRRPMGGVAMAASVTVVGGQ